jgi:excisionase family DNA binding protein
MQRLLKPCEAAERLRCSMPQIYAISSRGTLPKYKIGARLFFKEEDVDAYVEQCRIEARELLQV